MVRFSIEQALPPTAPERRMMNKVLEALLGGSLKAWALVDNRTRTIVAVTTTAITVDVGTGEKNLLIYSLYGVVDRIGKDNWIEGFATIMKYAKDSGCMKIIGFTKDDLIKRLVRHFKGDADWSFVSIDVDTV
jgi:hypothetical protein